MQIFEYPYVIITILVMILILLGAVGIFFLLQGVKAAKGEEIDFSSISRLENGFLRLGKLCQNRTLIYISLSLDNVRSLYSDAKAQNIYYEIKPILLRTFCGDDGTGIAVCDQQNFIVLQTWGAEETKKRVGECLAEIGRCLLRHKVIGTVDVRFGSYCTLATEISFDDAKARAKQACSMAESENEPHMAWDSRSGKALEKRIQIENKIESEIDNNRFFLAYQPVLDAKTKKIVGAEVLARLNSETEGVLTPGSFLSAVRSVGLDDKFDYYIFEKNCKWISNDRENREKYIYTINFSRNTLCDVQFTETITEILARYALDARTVAIEVLEDENITGAQREIMIANLRKLKEKGISVLLDDFGSGYTTFSDLESFSIATVKIDKAITQKSHTENGLVILKNIIRTAHELGMRVVCEGIETKEQEETAIGAGCDMLQGYYYYRPVSVTRLAEILEENG